MINWLTKQNGLYKDVLLSVKHLYSCLLYTSFTESETQSKIIFIYFYLVLISLIRLFFKSGPVSTPLILLTQTQFENKMRIHNKIGTYTTKCLINFRHLKSNVFCKSTVSSHVNPCNDAESSSQLSGNDKRDFPPKILPILSALHYSLFT